jgi:hypothetical protein
MFNLLVSGSGWAPNRDTMLLSRTLNYTRDDLKERFQPGGVPDFTALMRLPTLFMVEGRNSEVAHVGTIARAQIIGRDIQLEYFYDSDVPPLLNSDIVDMAKEFTMHDWEFGNTHWAVKDVDLFRVLLRNTKPRRLRPTVFRIAEFESIEDGLVSVMMPFDSSFDAVYRTIQGSAVAVGMALQRVDNIWEDSAIIQDVVSLIDRSKVVICDCTGKNSNVFYEIGIAHTLGREVILITQSANDIPFDLRHLRYIPYSNTRAGLLLLQTQLQARVSDIAKC